MYPGKNPEELAFSCVLFPILPDKPQQTDSPPTYPKLTNMFVLSGQFADVGRTLGPHCRCLRMFPGKVTLFTDVPSLFADVLTKPADLAIGDHRAPQWVIPPPGASFTQWSADCPNLHACVSSKKLCVIETIHQKPIIGGLLSLVALLSNNTVVNPLW